jgi:toxin HigB-1
MKVVVSRHVTRYSDGVILSFRHKGLEKLYREGTKKGVQADHVPKLLRVLSALDVAQGPDDLAIPSFTFRFIESDVELVDYQDYH